MRSKRDLRRENFARIKELSTAERELATSRIAAHLAENKSFQKARTVFSYLPLPSEPDLSGLVDQFREKRWCFSRVTEASRLQFYEVNDPSQVELGDFGFPEPDPKHCEAVIENEADVILIPGVGFDPVKRARLGRGKGHYDRFLARALEGEKRMNLIGICFSIQLGELTPERHDVPMSEIATECGITS